jgi:signal recognition particle GTPase
LIKQFDETRRMMKMMTTSGGKGMMKMMQNMQGAKR